MSRKIKLAWIAGTLQQGSLGVRANSQHFTVALQALMDAPTTAERVFELALKHRMVSSLNAKRLV